MGELNYWTASNHRPKPLVSLPGAMCHRCPQGIGGVPLDKVHLLPAPDRHGYCRLFVCPYCRTDVREAIDTAEAMRLFAAGVSVIGRRHPGLTPGPLTVHEVARLSRALADTHDPAQLALEESLEHGAASEGAG